MPTVNSSKADVLRYWRTLELFSQRITPELNPSRRVWPVIIGRPLPWQVGHPQHAIRLGEGRQWRHVVYCGVYPMESISSLLPQVVPGGDQRHTSLPGSSALATFAVTGQGRLIPGSVAVSSAAWAFGRAFAPGPDHPDWLAGADAELAEIEQSLHRISGVPATPAMATARPRPPATGHPIGHGTLVTLLRELTSRLGLDHVLAPHEIRVHSVIVDEQAPPGDRTMPAGSNLADLGTVIDAVDAGRYGAALDHYLSGTEIPKTDIRADIGPVVAITAPANVPQGRWPGPVDTLATLSQQQAVNVAQATLGPGRGILAVNAPPGTGRTTVLRELAASIVVERAKVLASLAQPEDAFAGWISWSLNGRQISLPRWRHELTGFEMVVAGCGAHADDAAQFAGLAAFDPSWRAYGDSLADIGTTMLNIRSLHRTRAAWSDAWALIATNLHAEDLPRRATALWDGVVYSPASRQQATESLSDLTLPKPRRGLAQALVDYSSEPAPDWSASLAAFRAALTAEQQLRQVRERAFTAMQTLADAKRNRLKLIAASTEAGQREADLRQAQTTERRTLQGMAREYDLLLKARDEHRSQRPKLTSGLKNRSQRRRDWLQRDRQLATALTQTEEQVADQQSHLQRLQLSLEEATANSQQARERVAKAEQELAERAEAIKQAKESAGDFLPSTALAADPGAQQTRAPWTDPEWNTARSRVFLAALELHRDFLRALPASMFDALQSAIDLLRAPQGTRLPTPVARAAWQSIFFAVPVICTDLASVPGIFGSLDSESIGWLVLDQAQLANAPDAVGAIWRARRVLALGDRMHAGPAQQLPQSIQQIVRAQQGVQANWLPGRISTMSLAADATALGTGIRDDSGTWLGLPLRALCRSREPMVAILNAIAYDGLMVALPPAPGAASDVIRRPSAGPLGTPVPAAARRRAVGGGRFTADDGDARLLPAAEAAEAAEPDHRTGAGVLPLTELPDRLPDRVDRLPASAWLDVPTASTQGHWVPAEGSAVASVVRHLAHGGCRDVLVVSPFEEVTRQLRPLTAEYVGLRTGTMDAIGGSAEVTVLVLGGDPDRPAQMQRLAEHPGPLAATVATARSRLYVIGDHRRWSRLRYFADLAEHLAVVGSGGQTISSAEARPQVVG